MIFFRVHAPRSGRMGAAHSIDMSSQEGPSLPQGQGISKELAEIVRGVSGAGLGEPLSRHLQVGGGATRRDSAAADDGCTPGDQRASGAGDGVLSPGVRDAPAARGEPMRADAKGRRAVRARRLFRRGGGDGAWHMHVPPGRMLAVDIETTGLDPRVDEVTCACAFDPDGGVARAFVFGRDGAAAREEFLALLDGAPRLCAFNGARFDLPFLARRWGLSAARVGAWVRKLVDPFEASKLALGRTFSLDRLLAANGLAGKTGSGLHAVALARAGQWDELAEYCMHDTRMTHAAAAMPALRLPDFVPRGKNK